MGSSGEARRMAMVALERALQAADVDGSGPALGLAAHATARVPRRRRRPHPLPPLLRAGTSRGKTPHLPLTVAGGSIGVRLRVPLTTQAQGSISSLRQLRQVLLSRSDSELAEAVRSNVWLLCGTDWSAFECGTD